jgi:signal peptidase II
MLRSTLKNYFKNYWWKIIIIAVLLSIDMLTKFLLVNETATRTNIIDGVLVILPTENYGAGFSLLTGKVMFLIIITIVFLLCIICFDIMFKKKSVMFGISTALIVSGAIGNLIDRIFFGYVRDFIYLEFINFPVFNVADMCLTFGVILLAIYILFVMPKNEKTEKTANIDGAKVDDNLVADSQTAKDCQTTDSTKTNGNMQLCNNNQTSGDITSDNNSQIESCGASVENKSQNE